MIMYIKSSFTHNQPVQILLGQATISGVTWHSLRDPARDLLEIVSEYLIFSLGGI